MNAVAKNGMQFLSKLGFRGSALAVLALLSAGSPSFADGLDFKHAWREYEDARAKRLPRSATNVLWRIEREACAARRWPDALKAFTARFGGESRSPAAPGTACRLQVLGSLGLADHA